MVRKYFTNAEHSMSVTQDLENGASRKSIAIIELKSAIRKDED